MITKFFSFIFINNYFIGSSTFKNIVYDLKTVQSFTVLISLQSFAKYVRNTYLYTNNKQVSYLQWTVMGPLLVWRCTSFTNSTRSMMEEASKGQEWSGQHKYWNWWMVRVSGSCEKVWIKVWIVVKLLKILQLFLLL